MKTSLKSSSQFLAAGIAGVALFKLASASFMTGLPVGTLAAVGLSAGFLGLAAYDYSRRFEPLTLPVRVLRPLMPCTTPRSAAYGTDRKDRLAA